MDGKGLNIMANFLSRRLNAVFLLLIAIMSVFYYDGVLEKEPMNMHLWRQTDCLSLTRNFANGADLFSPEIDILLADQLTSGKTAGEFPILYYIVGKSWSLFGESVFLYRLFYLSIIVFGLFAFFRTLLLLGLGSFWSVLLPILLFTSPVYVVYGVSFLTDVPAFNFILIALFFMVKYLTQNKKVSFWMAVLFFALAGLIKVSSLILFIAIGALFLIDLVMGKIKAGKRLFQDKWTVFIGFSVVLFIVFTWYLYASFYNDTHQFKYTFNSVYPLWLMDGAGIERLFDGMLVMTSTIFFSKPMVVLLLVLPIVNLFLYRQVPVALYFSNLLVFLGGLLYFLLWAPLFENHDYYYIPLLIIFVSAFVSFLVAVKNTWPVVFHSWIVKIVFFGFFVFNFIYSLSVVKLKTRAADGDFPIVMNDQFVSIMKWTNWEVSANWWRYKDIQSDLLNSGVHKDDKVICLSDHSFSVSLYFLNRRGWTNFMNYSSEQDIQQLIDAGARYLLITDQVQMNQRFVQPFLTNKIGEFKGIHVFKLV